MELAPSTMLSPDGENITSFPSTLLYPVLYGSDPAIYGKNISHMFQVGSGARGSVTGQRLRGFEGLTEEPNSNPFATYFKNIFDLDSYSHKTMILYSRVITALMSRIGATLFAHLAVNTQVNKTLLKNDFLGNFDNVTVLQSQPSSKHDGWSSLAILLTLVPILGLLLVTTCSPHRHHGHRHRAHRGEDDP